MEVIDESIREICWLDEALRCTHIGFMGVQEAPTVRSTMCLVILVLLSNEATLTSTLQITGSFQGSRLFFFFRFPFFFPFDFFGPNLSGSQLKLNIG